MSTEITGLTSDGATVTVDDEGTVSQATTNEEQDVAAEMRAALGVEEPAAAKKEEKADAPAGEANTEGAEEIVEVAVEEEAEGEKKGESGDEKIEEKTEDEKKDEKTEAEKSDTVETEADEKPAPAEPSEAETLVEAIGGVEIVKKAQPLIEAAYDPSLPVSERLARVEGFFPEAQMAEMRNEVFWQAAEKDDVREILAADPEAREEFAQRNFGVPYSYLEKVIGEEKSFHGDAFAEALAEFTKENPPPVKAPKSEIPKAEKPADDKPETKAKEEPKPETLTPAFTGILNTLSDDVDKVFATAQLSPDENDDAQTRQLKQEAAQSLGEEDWVKAYTADEEAMKIFRQIKALADSGAEAQAKELYPKLARAAKRVAVKMVEAATGPVKAHREKIQGKAKAAAAARTEKPAAAKTVPLALEQPKIDLASLQSDKDIERAMAEHMDRNSK